ncbi:DUF3422 domain-containing protein [Sphingobium phenoxybenzoativorans]|nr:DUF3422 domain-containing protein [Sphingobium phenoxybenzoativorans]
MKPQRSKRRESRNAAADMGLVDHPLRRQVVGEMQLRRFPAFSPPARIVQIVRLVEDRVAEAEALTQLLPDFDPAARHAERLCGADMRLGWERHSEASTMTMVITGDAGTGAGTGTGAGAGVWNWTLPPDTALIDTLPGTVVRASHLIVIDGEDEAAAAADAAGFAGHQLVTCHVRSPSGGRARLWTDFRIHDDGYGRMVVASLDMPSADLARCVQQLQELGNYRNLALIGLSEARKAWTALDALEGALEGVGQSLAKGDRRDDELLESLTSLSAQLLSIDSRCGYRMSATAAYARIVASRLDQLRVEPIAGYQSLADFTERRFHPAIQTCAALTDRLALLNARAAQFTALLRTRIETHIENQNARLLASMDESARMQLRLQHLVEGLSAVAISYYLIGLIAYPLKAAEKHWPAFSATLWLGMLVPPVILVLILSMRRVRHRLVSSDKGTH